MRTQKLEHRVFVLDATADGADVAFFTLIKEQHARTVADSEKNAPVSVRLELARVNPRGHVKSESGTVLTSSLEGTASIETSMFVEFARANIRPNDGWEVLENGRPPRAWKVVGADAVNGTTCIKVVGIQQSDDWDAPRGDRSAWRRLDTIWLAPNLGVALRVERVMEHREAARQDPSIRAVTEFTLENRMAYGQLAEDRRREIMLVHHLSEKMKPHLKAPEKANAKVFDELLSRIAQHNEKHPATPYRQAVHNIRHRIEAVRRGDAVPVSYDEETVTPTQVIGLGQAAPDFVTTDLGKRESVRLRKLLGQPIVMVFYHPTSKNAVDILKFAQRIADTHRQVTVLGLAVSDDVETVLKQRDALKLTFPLASGLGLKLTYAVDGTPKFVVLDPNGVVRGAYVGWGRELPDLVTTELARWKSR